MFELSATFFKIGGILAAVVAVQWCIRLLMMRRGMAQRVVLSESSWPDDLPDPPRISVLVAARNEEENIETCVRSLLAQNHDNLEVIAINDRSTDRTADILNELEAESDGRLKVIHIENLPAGWYGKSHAMHRGVMSATGEWLCFTDADCRQVSQRTVSLSIREALETDTDMLTVTPVVEIRSIWDRLVLPACAQTLMFWFQPRLVNDPKHPNAYGNGAFMMMSRECYDIIGGFESVRNSINEDMRLARAAKQSGCRLRMVENGDLYLTRMYDSLKDTWRGWTRIFGCLDSSRKLLTTKALITAFTLLPWCAFGIAVAGRIFGPSGDAAGWNTLIAAWGGVLLLAQISSWWFYRLLGIHPLWSLVSVIGSASTAAILGNAWLCRRGWSTTTWRGTTYRGKRRLLPEPQSAIHHAGPGSPVKAATSDRLVLTGSSPGADQTEDV